jgi:hypothetical protein
MKGDLRVEQRRDEDLRRHVRMARLLDPATPAHAWQTPTLLDVRRVGMNPPGFERVEDVDCAGSWRILDVG